MGLQIKQNGDESEEERKRDIVFEFFENFGIAEIFEIFEMWTHVQTDQFPYVASKMYGEIFCEYMYLFSEPCYM